MRRLPRRGWIDESEPEYVPVNAFVAADVIGTHGRGVYGGYNRASGGGWLRRTDGSLFYEVRDTVPFHPGLPARPPAIASDCVPRAVTVKRETDR